MPFCWNRGAHLAPVPELDCVTTVMQLIRGPDYNIPRTWTSTEDWVLKKWTSGDCTVAVVAQQDMVEDQFSLALIAEMAGIVVDNCATATHPYGGRVKIGRRRAFDIAVANRETFDWPEELAIRPAKSAR